MDKTDRIIGSLLGGAVADAIGAKFEWQSYQQILQRFPRPSDLFEFAHEDEDPFHYTDDTQFTLCVAECLVKNHDIKVETLAPIMLDRYEAWRGYGKGTRTIMEALANGDNHRLVSKAYFPDGSYGNGSAMRAAPIGLYYSHINEDFHLAIIESSIITHDHMLAIEGTSLMAHATQLLSQTSQFDRVQFFTKLIAVSKSDEFRSAIKLASEAKTFDCLLEMGSDITAHGSVPTALACFSIHHASYIDCIGTAIQIGGDTDTVASMAGQLFGALNGSSQIPESLLNKLENDNQPYATTHIVKIANSFNS